MTDTRQALAFALACHIKTLRASGRNDGLVEDMERARAALAAQPEPSAQGEPVAEVFDTFGNSQDPNKAVGNVWLKAGYFPPKGTKLYASAPSTPPPAVVEAVPLTDEQVWRDDGIMSANAGAQLLMPCLMELVRAIERAHGIAPKAAQEKT